MQQHQQQYHEQEQPLVNSNSYKHVSASTTTLNRDYSPVHSDNSDSTIYLTTYKTAAGTHKTNSNSYFNDEPKVHNHHHHHHHHQQQQHRQTHYEPQQQQQLYKSQLNQTTPVILKSNLKNYNSQQQQQQQQQQQLQLQQQQQQQLQHQKQQKMSLLNSDDYIINNFRPFSGQSQRPAIVTQHQTRPSSYINKTNKPSYINNSITTSTNNSTQFVPNTFLTTTSWKINDYNNNHSVATPSTTNHNNHSNINNMETSKSINNSKYQLVNSTPSLLRLELNEDHNNYEDTLTNTSITSSATTNNNNNRLMSNPDFYSHSAILSSYDHNSNSINNMMYNNINNISSSKFNFSIFIKLLLLLLPILFYCSHIYYLSLLFN